MRDAAVAAFLASAGWARDGAEPIPGDASRRRYFRLLRNADSAILMDASPETGEDTHAFHRISDHLVTCGLSAPRILRADHDLGLLLLEDLGPDQVSLHLTARPEDEGPVYAAVTDVLLALQTCPVLADLPRLTPDIAAQMLSPFFDHAAPGAPRSEVEAEIEHLFSGCIRPAQTLSLRDFHAENLIWRPGRTGLDKVGILDFQDAFIAPGAYDLVSLLRDARRDVGPSTEQQVLDAFAAGTGMDRSTLDQEVAILSVQRNLRIIGIFHRLIFQEAKPRYQDFIPRVVAHIRRDLDHPALHKLRVLINDLIPPTTYPA
ncbi:aminoglycoside phosphotransferase family protein [Marivivens marinus]|uniref:aminoglycoside phosphotransferase family protein n=1 Tax=Marivivens marinus TaxID=3110173 RepID=UPI003B84A7A8